MVHYYFVKLSVWGYDDRVIEKEASSKMETYLGIAYMDRKDEGICSRIPMRVHSPNQWEQCQCGLVHLMGCSSSGCGVNIKWAGLSVAAIVLIF